jgi:mannose-1-phosphate guanylyltransferase
MSMYSLQSLVGVISVVGVHCILYFQSEEGKDSVVGNVILHNCTNTIVHTADEKKTVVVGLKDYIVSEKSGQLLICPLSDEQHIKEYSQE